ncbi:MAG: gamma-glutamyltransferase, partial [Proteobacteria bacterium]|nr:gamma-glutamyltransferase [Pseudomonadota bacterium]
MKRTANIYLTSATAVLFVLVTAAAGPLVEAALGADGGQLSGQLLSGRMGAVAAEHRLASEAGLEILALGGNAIDAAVAATLATGVVNPSSAGLGGGGFMLLWLADGRGARALDFRETAPSAARRDTFMSEGLADDASRRGGLAVAVPGEAAGMAWALQHYG